MKDFDLSLYLVLDPVLCRDLGMVETTRAAVAGGATIIQLRDKDASTTAMVETGRALKQILHGTNVRLIVNDNVEAAIAIGADGLHIGQEDMNAADARRMIGPDMILGLSVETKALASAIDADIVDYAGIGPVFATPTKPDHKQPIGFEGLARIIKLCPVPAVAIGGLKPEHAADALSAGADGLAVVSAICGQPNPEAATALIAKAIKEARQ
ncbi:MULTISPECIES: thiamine phosphate synthase [unclassified Rhizobium]|jgi:thiamine-phosphate pyrophosphorylase|uniref:thiamine phosphate synthase n=1 Tax=unclassified Rhizobium TaxID=2613769 RepID=UPI0006460C24|nr:MULTISPECIES: thiamine phosphate synthase [unclassified Rhizobium]MBN8952879.1 thiamine phosphate synthase [Rhizobium tropici]OJY76601.1 MAG: thiamine-phosphate diphosphorylase [Rhizobium sp. 60-20]RKD52603.1 thiamine-phosphate diphosphorylase [Rhizobium sp. WW_1]